EGGGKGKEEGGEDRGGEGVRRRCVPLPPSPGGFVVVESGCSLHNRLSPGAAREHALVTCVIVDGPGSCRTPSPCMHIARVRHARWIERCKTQPVFRTHAGGTTA